MTDAGGAPATDTRAAAGDPPVQETLALIRAHGAIRFIALPFFLGAIGTLATAYHGDGPVPKPLIAGTAAGICVVAATIEVVLSRNLIAWWAAIGRHCEQDPRWNLVRAHRAPGALRAVRWTLFAPYLAGLGYWLHELARRLPALAEPGDAGARAAAVAIVLVVVAAVAAGAWRRAEAAPAAQPPPSGT